jgi:hypothetical protein
VRLWLDRSIHGVVLHPGQHPAGPGDDEGGGGGGAARVHVPLRLPRHQEMAPPRLLGLTDDPDCSDLLPSFPVVGHAAFLLRTSACSRVRSSARCTSTAPTTRCCCPASAETPAARTSTNSSSSSAIPRRCGMAAAAWQLGDSRRENTEEYGAVEAGSFFSLRMRELLDGATVWISPQYTDAGCYTASGDNLILVGTTECTRYFFPLRNIQGINYPSCPLKSVKKS